MAYGHGISVNLVQLARAYSIFATDGEVKPVTLLKTDGHVAGRPVLKPETARAVRKMLEMATKPGGTAPKAQVVGYRVAGKTGTGEVVGKRDTSWFVSYAPANRPRWVVSVVVAQGGPGARTAAPVARAVHESLRTLR